MVALPVLLVWLNRGGEVGSSAFERKEGCSQPAGMKEGSYKASGVWAAG